MNQTVHLLQKKIIKNKKTDLSINTQRVSFSSLTSFTSLDRIFFSASTSPSSSLHQECRLPVGLFPPTWPHQCQCLFPTLFRLSISPSFLFLLLFSRAWWDVRKRNRRCGDVWAHGGCATRMGEAAELEVLGDGWGWDRGVLWAGERDVCGAAASSFVHVFFFFLRGCSQSSLAGPDRRQVVAMLVLCSHPEPLLF